MTSRPRRSARRPGGHRPRAVVGLLLGLVAALVASGCAGESIDEVMAEAEPATPSAPPERDDAVPPDDVPPDDEAGPPTGGDDIEVLIDLIVDHVRPTGDEEPCMRSTLAGRDAEFPADTDGRHPPPVVGRALLEVSTCLSNLAFADLIIYYSPQQAACVHDVYDTVPVEGLGALVLASTSTAATPSPEALLAEAEVLAGSYACVDDDIAFVAIYAAYGWGLGLPEPDSLCITDELLGSSPGALVPLMERGPVVDDVVRLFPEALEACGLTAGQGPTR